MKSDDCSYGVSLCSCHVPMCASLTEGSEVGPM